MFEETIAALGELGRRPGPDGLLGLERAAETLDAFLAAAAASRAGPHLAVVWGAADSGKSTLCEAALARAGCEVLRFAGEGEDPPGALAAARTFASSAGAGVIAAMRGATPGAMRGVKAVLLDDCLPDSGAACQFFDALAQARPLPRIIVCVTMQSPARRPTPELLGRARAALELARPPPAAAARRLAEAMRAASGDPSDEAELEALLRGDAGGSMVRALCIVESRLWGGGAAASTAPTTAGLDDGFVARVARALALSASGEWGLNEVAQCVSSEPAMAVMLAHEWWPRPDGPGGRARALRDLVDFGRVPHGLTSVTEAVCAASIIRAARQGARAQAGFPACYTALSQRAASLRRNGGEEAKFTAWLAGRVALFFPPD